MQTIELNALQGVLSLLALAVAGAVTFVTPHVKEWIQSHIFKNNAHASTVANEVIDGLAAIAETTVQSFNQKVVNDAKASGTFTPELAASVKKDVIQAVMSQGSALVALGYKVVGDMPTLIETLVESAVNLHHTTTPVTVPATPIGTTLNPTV